MHCRLEFSFSSPSCQFYIHFLSFFKHTQKTELCTELNGFTITSPNSLSCLAGGVVYQFLRISFTELMYTSIKKHFLKFRTVIFPQLHSFEDRLRGLNIKTPAVFSFPKLFGQWIFLAKTIKRLMYFTWIFKIPHSLILIILVLIKTINQFISHLSKCSHKS